MKICWVVKPLRPSCAYAHVDRVTKRSLQGLRAQELPSVRTTTANRLNKQHSVSRIGEGRSVSQSQSNGRQPISGPGRSGGDGRRTT